MHRHHPRAPPVPSAKAPRPSSVKAKGPSAVKAKGPSVIAKPPLSEGQGPLSPGRALAPLPAKAKAPFTAKAPLPAASKRPPPPKTALCARSREGQGASSQGRSPFPLCSPGPFHRRSKAGVRVRA